MIRTLLCSGALLLAGPAFAQSATGGQEMAPAEQAAPADSAQPSTVDVAVVVDSEFPSYDGDKNGELSQTEFTAWMTTLKKAEIASTGQALGDQEISAWASTAFAMADQAKSKAVSKTSTEEQTSELQSLMR